MNWQPISTAPKDGTRILVARDGMVFTTKWHKCTTYRGGQLEPEVTYDFWACGSAPTHWQALPDPPEAA